MPICNFEAPNGNNSLLFAGLSQLLGETTATHAWYLLRSPKYIVRTGDWTDPRSKMVNIQRDINGEPTLEAALQVLGLGTIAHAKSHVKFAEAWKLQRVPGTMNQYYSGPNQAAKMAKRLETVSGDLYRNLRIRYDRGTARLEISPRYPEHTGGMSLFSMEKPTVNHRSQMEYRDGSGGRKMRPEFRNMSTMDLVRDDKRTATSREWEKLKNIKKGDIVEFYDSTGTTVLVEVTTDPYSVDTISAEEWSKLEGWDTSVYEKVKAKKFYQYQFKRWIPGLELDPADDIRTDLSLQGTVVRNRTYNGKITSLGENQVFVFGANSSGIHGRGAAGVAAGQERSQKEFNKLLKKGEKLKWVTAFEHSKISEGTEGKSYPLVTVEGDLGGKNKGNRMDEDKLLNNIRGLYKTALENPNLQFLVAYTAGGNNLNGFKDEEMANLFVRAGVIPDNIIFEDKFVNLMDNLAVRFIGTEITTQDQSLRDPLDTDKVALEQARKETQIEIREADGTKSGRFFDTFQQEQATDSIMYMIAMMVNQQKKVTATEIREVIKNKWSGILHKIYHVKAQGRAVMSGGVEYYTELSQEKAAMYARNMQDVLNTLDDLMIDSFRRLEVYGIRITNRDNGVHYSVGTDGQLVSEEGKGLENFNEVVFRLDPRDTASGRLKLFLASIENVEEAIRPKPKNVSIPLGHVYIQQILEGQRNYTVRTEKQLKDIGLRTDTEDRGTLKLDNKLYEVRVVKRLTAAEAAEYNEGDQRENLDYTRVNAKGVEEIASKHIAAEGDYMLEIVPFVESKGLVNVPSFIGTPTLVDFDSLFEAVTGTLADRKPDFETYMQALESGRPEMRRLAEKLRSQLTPEQIRREFMTVMTKAYTEYALVLYSPTRGGMEVRTINANTYSAKKMVIESWRQNQKNSEMVKKNEAGMYVIDQDTVQKLRAEYTKLQAIRAVIDTTKGNAKTNLIQQYNIEGRKLVDLMLKTNGIQLTAKMYEDLYKAHPNMLTEWGVTKEGTPNGLFSTFMLKLLNTKPEEQEMEMSLERNNPLYSESSTVNKLGAVYVKHAELIYNSSHRDLSGNNIWDYTLNRYLVKAFQEFTAEDDSYRKQLRNTYFGKNNWLLDILQENQKSRERMKLMFLEGMTKRKSKASAERAEMSDRDQLFMALGMYMNGGWNTAHYVSLTHSDKTSTPVFMNMPRTWTWQGDKISTKLMDRLYSVFESEFDRIVGTSRTMYAEQQFEQGKKYFYLLPEFNYENMVAMVKEKKLTEQELAQMWVAPGQLNHPNKGTEGHTAVVNKLLTQFIARESRIQLNKFIDTGIVNMKAKKHMFDPKYIADVIEKQRNVKNLYGKYFDNSVTPVKQLTEEEYFNIIAQAVARDFAMNTFLMNTAIVQNLTGDPAQVFKKSVEGTLVEYQKRLAGHIAPGKETEWPQQLRFYKTAVLEDYEVALSYLDSENLRGKYANTNVTDAQEFVTMQEHLDVMFHYGMLPKDVYDDMSRIIKESEGGYYEFKDPRHLDVVLQITKPVYYGKRPAPQQGVLLHDYVKSSAMPLYPPHTAGTEMDKLRRKMEADDIRRVQFVSAKKVGYVKPAKAFDSNGAYAGIDEGSVQILDRTGFRIQQEVPYDPLKDEILTASQANKLIVADLPEAFSVTLMDGKRYDRNQIREKKEQLRIDMLNESLNALQKELDIVRDEAEGTFRFLDKKKFIDRLIKEGKRKNYSDNELAPLTHLIDGEPICPIFFTSLSEPLQNLMMSMIDDMIKVKVPGKSYVQASSVGLRTIRTDYSGIAGIHWLPGHDRKRELRMPVRYRTDDIMGTEQVTPAEILVPFHFFTGDKKLSMVDFLGEDGTIDVSKLPEEVLHMVGIRIPTSKHNTMLPMKIVGFLPENMGDTIIVPPGITTQMGSDFDVDKLFVYRKPYTASKGQITADTEGSYAEYFDLHFKILTSPHVYDMMMSPLDKMDLKNEAALVKTQSGKSNFFTANSQLEDFISQKDAKRLVGFGALTNTFLATIQPLRLKLGYIEYNEEGEQVEVEDPITFFGFNENQRLSLINLSGYGMSSYAKDSTSPVELRTKMDNINILLQEFLDHAKHRTIDKINLTVHTYPAAAALLSLEDPNQLSLNVSYAARLVAQPIVREYNLRMQRGNDMLGEYIPDLKNTVLNDLRSELIDRFTAAGGTAEELDLKDLILTDDNLKTNMNKPLDTNSKDFIAYQLQVLRAFERLEQIGTRMSEMAALVNVDVKGTGGSLFEVMDKISKRDNVLGQDVILNGFDILNTPTDEEGAEKMSEKGWIFTTVTEMGSTLFSDYMPHAMLHEEVLVPIQRFMNRPSMTSLSLDTKKDIMRSVRSLVYALATQHFGVENLQAERARLLYETPSGPSLAQRVQAAQLTGWGQKNYFLQRLHVDLGNGVDPQAVNFIASKVTRMDDVQNVRAFLDMLLSEDKNIRLLGEDLVRYAFLTGGIQDAKSFVRYIPFGYLMSTNWYSALRTAYQSLPTILSEGNFIEQWFRHNPEKAIAMSPNFEDTGKTIEGVPELFTFPYPVAETRTAADTKYTIQIGSGRSKTFEYTPYISYRTPDGKVVLYKKIVKENGTPQTGIVYARMDTLGNSTTDEYNGHEPNSRSIITGNRAFNTDWQGVMSTEDLVTAPVGVDTKAQETTQNGIDPVYTLELGIDKRITEEDELMDRILPGIINDPSTPQAYAAVFEVIRTMSKSADLRAIQKSIKEFVAEKEKNNEATNNFPRDPWQEAPSENLRVKIESSMSVFGAAGAGGARVHAQYDAARNIISFTPEAQGSPKQDLLHELTHWLAYPFIAYAQGTQGRSANSWFGKEVSKVMGNNPNLIQASQRIVNLWEHVKTLNRYNGQYWMSNPDEFLAHAMTDKEVMKILNGIEAPRSQRTMLQEIWDAISKLFDAIQQFIGMPVDKDSVLAEALKHGMQIMAQRESLTILDIDEFIYLGRPVTIGVNNGVGVKVSDDFLKGSPEPLRQLEISKVLDLYNRRNDEEDDTPPWEEDPTPQTPVTPEEPYDGEDPPWDEEPAPTSPSTNLNSRYELFPGVFANEGQRKAIDTITEHIQQTLEKGASVPFMDRAFVLSGPGGTGKTTIIRKIAEQFPDRKVAFAAPSHNAVVELKQALGVSRIRTNNWSVNTLQSELRMQKDNKASYEQKKEVFVQGPRSAAFPKPFEIADIVIVDESSMVEDQMIEWLEKAVKPDSVIIFMGDYGQIFPVGQNVQSIPFRKIMDKRGVSLLENMRTNKADIAAHLQEYRLAIDTAAGNPASYVTPVIPFKDRVQSENVTLLRKPSELLDKYVEQFKKDPGNPKNALLIVSRNATRISHNQEIRSRLFGGNLSKFVKGDLVIVDTPIKATRDSKILMDLFDTAQFFPMQRLIVESYEELPALTQSVFIGDRATEFTLPGVRLMVNLGPDGGNKVVELQGFDPQVVNEILTVAKKAYNESTRQMDFSAIPAMKQAFGARMSYGAWKEILPDLVAGMQSASANLDYAYAVTAHKSQGSTYNNTFVDEVDMYTNQFSKQEQTHLLYTAVSRTREHLYVYHPGNSNAKDMQLNQKMMSLSYTIANGSNGPWKYRNEAEARNMEQTAQKLGVPVRREMDMLIMRSVGDAKKDKTTAKTSHELENVITALENQKRAILDSMAGQQGRKERSAKKLQLDNIDSAIIKIRDQATLRSVAEVGKKQLEWISAIVEAATPQSIGDLMMAWRVSNVWADLLQILYPDGKLGAVDPELAQVAADARAIRGKLLSQHKEAMVMLSEDTLTKHDFTDKLKDMVGASAYALSLNRSSSQLVQLIDLQLKNAGRRKMEDLTVLVKQLSALEAKIKAYGNGDMQSVYEMLMQENKGNTAFGLVQRYSLKWFEDRSEARHTRDIRLKKIAENPALSDAIKAKNIAATWKTYWKEIDSIGVYADITKLFTEDGKFLADITGERNRLIGELGSEAEADRVIELARERYLGYLADREDYFLQVEQKFHEGIITDTEAAQQKTAFEQNNSPRIFMNAWNTKSYNSMNKGDRYTILSPRASKTEYYDSKYQKIQEDAALKEIYDEFTALLNQLKSYLPIYVQWKMHENFLPVVERHLIQDTSLKEYMATLGDRAVDSITAGMDEQTRMMEDKIPIRYIYKDVQKIDSYSRDLIRITELFGMMALHYRHFAVVKDAVDMGENILREINLQRLNNPNMGDAEVLTNTLKALEYAKDYLMYQKPRKLEGKSNIKLYSANPIVQRKIAQRVRELLEQRSALEEQQSDPPEGKTVMQIRNEIENIDIELTRYETMGKNIYLSKVGDRLIGINQLKALAFNPFSGFANLAFGMASLSIYANGNKDFTLNEALKAMGIVTNSTKRYLTFNKASDPTAEKIMHLMDKTGMMGDLVDSQYGESNLPGRKKGWKKYVDPYTFLRSSDYYMKASILVATMLHQQVKVTLPDGSTKEVSLWEAYDNEGNWVFSPDEAWTSEDSAKRPEWEKFRNRVTRIGQIVMGNMDKNSPKLMNKYVLGRLIGQFRGSWLPEGWAARWEDEKFDKQLDRNIKGRYRSYMDIGLEGSITVLLRQYAGWFTGNKDYFAGIMVDKGGNRIRLDRSEVDMDNMRRNFTGLNWTLLLMGAVMMLRWMIDDDDEETGVLRESLMIVLNLMNRVNQDLQFYASPDVANNLIRNTIPAFDVIIDYKKAVEATKKAIMSEDYDWDEAALKWTKATPYLNQINRVRYMTTHDISEVSR